HTLYPAQLELFARVPDTIEFVEPVHLAPVHFEAELANLSAIVLSDGYYEFIHEQVRDLQGITCLEEVGQIPLKAKAWLNLTTRRENGEDVRSRDIRKHRNDILRLSQLFNVEMYHELPDVVRNDLQKFLEAVEPDLTDDLLRQLFVDDTPHGVMSLLRNVFTRVSE
ncbi:MAG: hypothetical protein C0600_12505, partial [Ignavibacteria bacterium]